MCHELIPFILLKDPKNTGCEGAGPRKAQERVVAETKEPQPEQNQLQNNKTKGLDFSEFQEEDSLL